MSGEASGRARYFEEIEVGEVHEHGSYTVTEAEIVEFAERYDPQPFHVDPEAAADSFYGGLIASGWQTASACMPLIVEGFLNDAASMGAIGMEELTWHAPLRPGQTVNVENEILEVRPSGSRDDRGYVRSRTVGAHDGEPVITMVGTNVFARRPE